MCGGDRLGIEETARRRRRRRLHIKWCSCTEEAGKEFSGGLSEVIGTGCRCRCFLSFSTWKLRPAHKLDCGLVKAKACLRQLAGEGH